MSSNSVSKFMHRKKAERVARKRNKKIKEKLIGVLVGILIPVKMFFLKPFMPSIKKVRRIKGTVKAGKISGKVFKIIISLANIGISAYKFYDGFLKDKLNKDEKVVEN